MSLTILSYGGGQDSTVILHRMISELDAVVFADTGNEHPHTYETVKRAQAFAESHGVTFAWLRPASRFHKPSWPSLTGQWQRNDTIQLARSKACTDGLKITPIYKWLNDYCAQILGQPVQDRGKRNLVEYAQRHGRIRMVIGIAKGEEKRTGKDFPMQWQRDSVTRIYPLIDWGMGRAECQRYLDGVASVFGKVWPSNCMFCHYQSGPELLWLKRRYPEAFDQWAAFEAAKIRRYAHKEKNHGVYGAKLLPVKLLEAERDHGHLSDDELDSHKFSHGHCVQNAY